jgi:hypothetical protein
MAGTRHRRAQYRTKLRSILRDVTPRRGGKSRLLSTFRRAKWIVLHHTRRFPRSEQNSKRFGRTNLVRLMLLMPEAKLAERRDWRNFAPPLQIAQAK